MGGDRVHGGDTTSVPIFQIDCSCTDPNDCVLYITHGNLDLPDDGFDWMWMQECYGCPHSRLTVTPALHARRRHGQAMKNAKVCKKLDEFDSETNETDRVLAGIASDLADIERAEKLVA
jgi:hypothetical protein